MSKRLTNVKVEINTWLLDDVGNITAVEVVVGVLFVGDCDVVVDDELVLPNGVCPAVDDVVLLVVVDDVVLLAPVCSPDIDDVVLLVDDIVLLVIADVVVLIAAVDNVVLLAPVWLAIVDDILLLTAVGPAIVDVVLIGAEDDVVPLTDAVEAGLGDESTDDPVASVVSGGRVVDDVIFDVEAADALVAERLVTSAFEVLETSVISDIELLFDD